MEENLAFAFLPSRVAAILIGAFGLLGLTLASAGMYALIAYTVGQRKKEIGIRMAIGASRTSVLRMILSKAVKLAAWGVAIGFIISLGLSQVLKAFLIGIVPADPVTFGLAAIVVFGTALAASWLPAFRATQVNPVDSLRSE